jgi:thymidylate kinase
VTVEVALDHERDAGLTTPSYRVAVVGVDGSGKTSAVTRLRERVAIEGDLVTLHAPAFHEHPDAPFQRLSRELQAVSLAADALGLVELKAAMLYLRMTLYGAVERCLIGLFAPRVVISDRHALVDTLAYGELYRKLIGPRPDHERWEPVLREQLAPVAPLALDSALDYYARTAGRLGTPTDFWGLAHELAAVFERAPSEVLAELRCRFETEPPDAVVVFQIDPSEAFARSGGKDAASEIHESAEALTSLARLYDHAISVLGSELPGTAVHRIDVTGLGIDETVDAILATLPQPSTLTP